MITSAFIEKLDMIYFSCQRELEELRSNIALCLRDNARMRDHIAYTAMGVESCNVTENTLFATKNFISNMETMVDRARKFNVDLKMKYVDKVYTDYCPSLNCSLKEIFKYNNEYGNNTDLSFKREIQCVSVNETGLTAQQNGLPMALELSKIDRLDSFNNMLKKMNVFRSMGNKSLELTEFKKDYEFNAAISYIEDYENLVFYVCNWNDRVLELSQKVNLPNIKSLPWNRNTIFGVSRKKYIYRALRHSDGNTPATTKVLLMDSGEVMAIDDSFSLYKVPIRYQSIPMQAVKCILVGVAGASGLIYDNYELKTVLRENKHKFASFKVIKNINGVMRVLLLESREYDVGTNKFEFCTLAGKDSRNAVSKASNPFLNICGDDYDEMSSAQTFRCMKTNTTTTIQENADARNADSKASNPFLYIFDDDYDEMSSGQAVGSMKTHTTTTIQENADDRNSASETLNPFLNDWDDDEMSSAQAVGCMKTNTTTTIQENFLYKSLGGPDNTTKLSTVEIDRILNQKCCDWPVTIKVTHIIDVVSFYAQIHYNENEPDLIWGDIAQNQRLATPPQLHELVLAKYSEDANWYRGLVVKIDKMSSLFKVRFVDYGNSEMMTLNSMARCPTIYADKPFRGVRCRFADLSAADNNKERVETAINIASLILVNQVFDVIILKRDYKELFVRIIDEKYSDFETHMVKSGYAKAIKYQQDEF